MIYEHEITYNDNDIQYINSTTNYLNEDDKEFLEALGVDLKTIKKVTTYETNSQ